MKQQFITLYMDIADRVSEMSHAVRLKVGCVVVKNDNIISFSWNGTPPGFDNNCEDIVSVNVNGDPVLKTKNIVCHADANSLYKLAKDGISAKGATMFLTHAPCIECSKGIYSSGISTVIYKRDYKSTEGIDFLNACGIKVVKYDSLFGGL